MLQQRQVVIALEREAVEKGRGGWLPLVGEALYPSKLARSDKQKDGKIPSC